MGSIEADAEPSLGHSESIPADSGDEVEYGDRSDVMGAPLDAVIFRTPENVHSSPPGRIGGDRRHRNPRTKNDHYPSRGRLELGSLRIPVQNGRAYYVEALAPWGNDERIPDILKSGALVKRSNAVERANKSWLIDCTETPTENSGDSTSFPIVPAVIQPMDSSSVCERCRMV